MFAAVSRRRQHETAAVVGAEQFGSARKSGDGQFVAELIFAFEQLKLSDTRRMAAWQLEEYRMLISGTPRTTQRGSVIADEFFDYFITCDKHSSRFAADQMTGLTIGHLSELTSV